MRELHPPGGAIRKVAGVSAICAVAFAVSIQPALAAAPESQGSFTDAMSGYDVNRWMKADGWSNGSPFDNVWLADHIEFAAGEMDIRLDDQSDVREPYASGNYQTHGYYGYGCYEASFTPVAEPGVVTSFFTFAGPYDNGGNGRHNEIDIEFLGYSTTQFQVNFWANDDSYTRGHEHIVQLDFDASEAVHRYGFKWTAGGIEWFVDGVSVYQVASAPGDPTPSAAESLHKIMMNLWPVDATASGWAGTFEYPGYPLHAKYEWVRFIQGENCSLADPPDLGGPPLPAQETLHVERIELSPNLLGAQTMARVTILSNAGQPAVGATVGVAWSGTLNAGDTVAQTGDDGSAVFYSGVHALAQPTTLCVTGVSGSMPYAAQEDVETCDSTGN